MRNLLTTIRNNGSRERRHKVEQQQLTQNTKTMIIQCQFITVSYGYITTLRHRPNYLVLTIQFSMNSYTTHRMNKQNLEKCLTKE